MRLSEQYLNSFQLAKGTSTKTNHFNSKNGYSEWLFGISQPKVDPLRPTVIQKLLEIACCDRSRLGHKPYYWHGLLSEYVRKSTHACHGESVAQKRRRCGELGSIHRSLWWVTGDPIDLKGSLLSETTNLEIFSISCIFGIHPTVLIH